MSSGSDRGGTSRNNLSYALLPYEKRALQEARSYASKCGNKIAEDKQNFSEKGGLGLWWDAKGLFNVSSVGEVTDYMERYRQIYEKINNFSARVEEGDESSYEDLVDLYNELEEVEKDAESDVENNRSKAACQLLREFLADKYKLDHNLKKVECIVLKQKIRNVEQSNQSSRDAVGQLNERMSNLIEDNRDVKKIMETMRREKEEANRRSDAIRRESDERVKQLLNESETRFREMRKENDELRLEAERVRRESEERLKKAVEEANRRSEDRIQKMAEKTDATIKKMIKKLEDKNFP